MQTPELENLRYPVGRFNRKDTLTPAERTQMIQIIEGFPNDIKQAVNRMNDSQLDTPYRPDGWTVRQVVHHVVDSHLNSYIRFKWTLTEDQPLIKTYNQTAWAELADSKTGSLDLSLPLLEGLHNRWTQVLKNMVVDDFQAKLEHPEWGLITLDTMLGLYEWHCRHHLRHITSLSERMGW